ncbi:hypothetical protein [Candidatus Vidania fulgoroideorum]
MKSVYFFKNPYFLKKKIKKIKKIYYFKDIKKGNIYNNKIFIYLREHEEYILCDILYKHIYVFYDGYNINFFIKNNYILFFEKEKCNIKNNEVKLIKFNIIKHDIIDNIRKIEKIILDFIYFSKKNNLNFKKFNKIKFIIRSNLILFKKYKIKNFFFLKYCLFIINEFFLRKIQTNKSKKIHRS